jgi:hypothetical protein
MAKTATTSELSELHKKVATVLTSALEADDLANQEYLNGAPVYDDNGDEVPREPPKMNPALISVAVKFLKDNLITVAPEDDDAMSKLEQALAAKRKRKSIRNIPIVDEDGDQATVQ